MVEPLTKRILVVEDDPDLRELLKQTLAGEGFDVETTSDGFMALNTLRTGPLPHLILLDVKMPKMDGWQFCQARRANSALSSVPIVILSAHAGRSRVAPY